jgi:glycosyltransferase involved in cell wall biosynthesis
MNAILKSDMAAPPRISAVITAYNLAPYLVATIESVLAQQYPDFEVIVVDDGSTDESAAIAERFVADRRVTVIRQRNAGSAAARNAGARRARGELVAFLDGDDLAAPGRLERTAAEMSRHPEAALGYGRITLISEDNRLLESRVRPGRYRTGWVAKELRYRNFIPFSTTMVRRTVFEELGGFDEAIRSSEDWEFLWRLSNKYPVLFIDACLAYYRIRREAKTMDLGAKARAYQAVQEKIFKGRIPALAVAARLAGLASICLRRGERGRAAGFLCRAILRHPGVAILLRSEIRERLENLRPRRPLPATHPGGSLYV